MHRVKKALIVASVCLAASACQGGGLKPRAEGGASGGARQTPKGDIHVSLAHEFDAANDDYEILLSAPVETLEMVVCEVLPDEECEPDSDSYFPTDLIYETTKRRFFKATASALLEDGLTLSFLMLGDTGEALGQRTIEVALSESAAESQDVTD